MMPMVIPAPVKPRSSQTEGTPVYSSEVPLNWWIVRATWTWLTPASLATASSSLTFTRTFTAFSTFVTELRTVTPIPRRVVVSALCDAVTARCAATASNRAPTRSARWRAPTMESVDSTTVAATTRSGSALARRPVTPRAPSGMASWVNRPASRTGLGGDVSAAADGTAASTVAIAASTAETRFIPAPRRGSCEPVTGTIDQTDQRTGTFAPSHPVAARHSG